MKIALMLHTLCSAEAAAGRAGVIGEVQLGQKVVLASSLPPSSFPA